ncbi:MAG: hypothetical protein VKP57_03850 [Candidatus Sericytochromatia bacterium]|nr:hypothetical protein [Candidatus Sericytochromatia bacterium]
MRSVEQILDRAWAGGILVPGAPVALSPDAVVVDGLGCLQVAGGLGRLPPRHPMPRNEALRIAILDDGGTSPEMAGAARTLQDEGWWVTDAGGASPGRVVLEYLASPGRLIVGNHPEQAAGGAFGSLVLPARTADLLHLDRGLPMTTIAPTTCAVLLEADMPTCPDGTDVGLALWALAEPSSWQGRVILMEGPGAAALPVDDRIRCIAVLIRGGAVSVVFPGDTTAGEALDLLGRTMAPSAWLEGQKHEIHLAWSACTPRVLGPRPGDVPEPAQALDALRQPSVMLGGSGTGSAELLGRWLRMIGNRTPWQDGHLCLRPASPLESRRMAASGALDGWLRAGGCLAPDGSHAHLPDARGPLIGTDAWSREPAWLASPGTIAGWMAARWRVPDRLPALPVAWTHPDVPAWRGTWQEARQPEPGDPPVLWIPDKPLGDVALNTWVPVEMAAARLQDRLGNPPGVHAALRLEGAPDLGPIPDPWVQALATMGVVAVIADQWTPGLAALLAETGIRPWTRGGTTELVLRRPEGGPAERVMVDDPLDTVHAAIHESGGLASWLRLHLAGRSAWTTPSGP